MRSLICRNGFFGRKWPLNENLLQQTVYFHLPQQTDCEKLYPFSVLLIITGEGNLLGTFSGTLNYCKKLRTNFRRLSLFYSQNLFDSSIKSLLYNKKNPRFFSTKDPNKGLHPEFVTGLVDGEGCFTNTISKDKNYRCG